MKAEDFYSLNAEVAEAMVAATAKAQENRFIKIKNVLMDSHKTPMQIVFLKFKVSFIAPGVCLFLEGRSNYLSHVCGWIEHL